VDALVSRPRALVRMKLRTLGLCALLMAVSTGCSLLLDDDYSSGLRPAGSSGTASSTGGPPAAAPWGSPAEGTYSYSVTGGDNLRGPFPLSTTYGPTATVNVRHRGATCFAMTIIVRSGYDESMEMCLHGVDVAQESGVRTQNFPFITGATTALTCAPGDVYLTPAPSPGQVWTHDCAGKNKDGKSGDSEFRTTGPYRFAGKESLSVGGRDVSVMHYHDEREVTGSQTGTNVADWYFAVDSGLLVRLTRKIDIEYRAPFIGLVNYLETMEMTLTSTSPDQLSDAGTNAPADGDAGSPAK